MLITLSMWPRRRRPNTTGSRTAPKPFISDAQWNLIKDLFENPDPSPKGGPPRIDARACLEGIFWILKNGGRCETWKTGKEAVEQFKKASGQGKTPLSLYFVGGHCYGDKFICDVNRDFCYSADDVFTYASEKYTTEIHLLMQRIE